MDTASAKNKPAKKASIKAKCKYPDKFTNQTMANYISEKHEIPKVQARAILEDLFDAINAGVMMGERVPIGAIGKLHVRVKPATKARMGRNPITGEEIKIPAKKATQVPKFSFSKSFKQTAVKAKIKKK